MACVGCQIQHTNPIGFTLTVERCERDVSLNNTRNDLGEATRGTKPTAFVNEGPSVPILAKSTACEIDASSFYL